MVVVSGVVPVVTGPPPVFRSHGPKSLPSLISSPPFPPPTDSKTISWPLTSAHTIQAAVDDVARLSSRDLTCCVCTGAEWPCSATSGDEVWMKRVPGSYPHPCVLPPSWSSWWLQTSETLNVLYSNRYIIVVVAVVKNFFQFRQPLLSSPQINPSSFPPQSCLTWLLSNPIPWNYNPQHDSPLIISTQHLSLLLSSCVLANVSTRLNFRFWLRVDIFDDPAL